MALPEGVEDSGPDSGPEVRGEDGRGEAFELSSQSMSWDKVFTSASGPCSKQAFANSFSGAEDREGDPSQIVRMKAYHNEGEVKPEIDER